MRRLLIPIAALLLSDALLLVGHGLQLTVLPLRADLIGMSAAQIGFTGSAYFLGFVGGSLLTPLIVRRVGHIRSFAVLATVFSSVILLFHAVDAFVAWLGLRLVTGACISGLYMIIESWLNERATRETRGTILSIYTMINLTMITAGQLLLNLARVDAPTLFGLAAILFSLAIIPVSLTTALAPAPIRNVNVNLRRVWELSHVGVFGAVGTGMATGAFWALGPLYAREIGLAPFEITLFLGGAVLGGALLQLPLGRLSDRYDRRLVVLGSALAAAAISTLLVVLPGTLPWLTIGLATLWGGFAMTLYAICLAHANDRAPPEDFVVVGSGMLLTYGLSSAIGAPIASSLMELVGPRGLFLFAGIALLLLALGVSRRRSVHVLPVVDATEPFRNVARTSTLVLELDPRIEAAPAPEPGPDPVAPDDTEEPTPPARD